MSIKTIGQILLEKDVRVTNKQLKLIIESSQEYAEQFIELAANEAKIQVVRPHYDVRDPYEYEIDKESILEIKEQIK